ncbi:acetylcholine-gated chloride channel subunit acc-1-like [Penaeus monodon]|uniref:acetylcholine-gated chloride channel subunit acc-1-like n=1 Tax=Penaeus monodon TaxID=6687 RepID=UPI0018A76870|nr:acetylcholine-gated chloride channel subunit acc-1-like [Penaeus monodon]
MSDGTKSIVKPEILQEFLYVVREGEPLPSDTSRLNEDVLYRGSENTLLLIYVVRIEAMCIFRLHNYPFDRQKCQLGFSYYDNPEIGVLQKGEISMEATRELLEYEIVNETMTVGETNQFMSSLQVEIEFQNQYTFYITNVIVPTLLMAIICYLTFYFQLNDFQIWIDCSVDVSSTKLKKFPHCPRDRIVISLTSMLVLATLFTQMSQSIPKTAYFKVIDGWFMSLIVIDFLVVVIHTIIENLCGMRAPPVNKSVKHSPIQVAWSSHERSDTKGFIMAQKVNAASQIMFPFLITLMCTIFAIFGYSSLYMAS